MSFLLSVSSTGNVGPSTGGFLNSMSLTSAAAASTAVVRESGVGGTIVKSLAAAVGDSEGANFNDLHYTGQLHVTLTGAGATLDIEFE